MAQYEHARLPQDNQPFPRHIAIIMDGNGRWAAQRGLPRSEGHKKGVDSVRACVRAVCELGVPYLTLFGFSSENWNRPKEEIAFLMSLLKRFIRRDLAELHEQDIKIRVIGTDRGIEPEIVELISEAVHLTRNNSRLELTIAFNYGGRDDIVRAARAMAEAVKQGQLDPGDIDAALCERHLDTAELPDPDLLIRTSGEQRLSNFLLWQCAYTELVFVDQYWPEFSKETLVQAIAEFQSRERRFGGLSARCSG